MRPRPSPCACSRRRTRTDPPQPGAAPGHTARPMSRRSRRSGHRRAGRPFRCAPCSPRPTDQHAWRPSCWRCWPGARPCRVPGPRPASSTAQYASVPCSLRAAHWPFCRPATRRRRAPASPPGRPARPAAPATPKRRCAHRSAAQPRPLAQPWRRTWRQCARPSPLNTRPCHSGRQCAPGSRPPAWRCTARARRCRWPGWPAQRYTRPAARASWPAQPRQRLHTARQILPPARPRPPPTC